MRTSRTHLRARLFGAVALSALLALTACGGSDGGSGDSYTWRLGFNTNESSVRAAAAEKFKEIVEEESNGRITIEIFPAEALGSEQEMLNGVKTGSLELQMAGGGSMQNIVPEYAIMTLPFMVQSFDEAYALLDGPIGQGWKKQAEEQGYKVLSHHDLGFAQITNNVRPIRTPEDLEGIAMRSPDEPTSIATFEAMGANVSTLPFTEVYPGLQQGVIEGQFNPLDAIYETKFHEVQDHLTLVNIFYYHVNFIMNPDVWNGLDPELQEIVQKAADEAQTVSREQTQQNDKEMLETLRPEFEEIVEDPDLEAFRTAVEPAFSEFEKIVDPAKIQEARDFIEDYRAENQ
ncbi:tripartite ATP-independent transporter DctP family solute receptor [Haloactinopolyspora alba]|uniref:Tripartite ATP-independent transporter DctP family solute receptor n=1 Tax=Haloactinopolyspora alba TaxID=648780 RepID=A0A2P8DT23_9ACTN|nr:TRAP transporter substrate-binding protein [Haloactinopolyspora alba]PSL00366.1 tripartite ATP-independent transporter DctP family solute receptor [Haloactinopolyspora alba]